ncbi:hypothetical protein ACSBR2_010544 [Camellia fascicularis]
MKGPLLGAVVKAEASKHANAYLSMRAAAEKKVRMLESSYDLLFGKLALRCLFEDYFEEARHFSTRIMLKPINDRNCILLGCSYFSKAVISGPLNHEPKEKIMENALSHWQSDVDDPHTFIDFFVSNTDPTLLMRSCAYYPKYGFGAFGFFLMLLKKRVSSEDYGVEGLRYGSSNLSIGATLMMFSYWLRFALFALSTMAAD